MKPTKKEKAWLKKVQALTDECPACGGSGRAEETVENENPCPVCAPVRIAVHRIRKLDKPLESFSLYSDDDDVVLFDTERAASRAKARWEKAAANHVRGPYRHFGRI
ncbi:MAG: hypothetical protein HYT87_13010 [Nitrospirae bacterium]|nr:hypothetical protein [Nitrospirota bacterium]